MLTWVSDTGPIPYSLLPTPLGRHDIAAEVREGWAYLRGAPQVPLMKMEDATIHPQKKASSTEPIGSPHEGTP